MSLEETGHAALIGWVERQQRADPNDRAFTVLDDLEVDSLPESAETDTRNEDDLVDEWHGSDEYFTLADDPSAQS